VGRVIEVRKEIGATPVITFMATAAKQLMECCVAPYHLADA